MENRELLLRFPDDFYHYCLNNATRAYPEIAAPNAPLRNKLPTIGLGPKTWNAKG